MDTKEALKVFNDLIVQVMAAGGFKDLQTLDRCRDAYNVLKHNIEKPAETKP